MQRKRRTADKEAKSQASQEARTEDQGSTCLKWQDCVGERSHREEKGRETSPTPGLERFRVERWSEKG